jgi:hypothetical protein
MSAAAPPHGAGVPRAADRASVAAPHGDDVPRRAETLAGRRW